MNKITRILGLALVALILPLSSQGQTWKSISAGIQFGAAVKADGTLHTFGNNGDGQLGDGGVVADTNETIQIGTDNDWAMVECAPFTLFAIKNNGDLYATGSNNGLYGDGNVTSANTLTKIGTDKWSTIAANQFNTAGVKTDGTLWIWGDNSVGQFGNNATSVTPSPVPVQVGTATNWEDVELGSGFVIALKTDGTIYSAGQNGAGQLGNGTTNADSNLVQIGTATNWDQISANNGFTIALKDDGTAWVWGSNGNGQIDDTAAAGQILSPTQFGTASDWAFVEAGNVYSFAIKTSGALWGWGFNQNGCLGDGFPSFYSAPAQIGTATDWDFVATSDFLINGTPPSLFGSFSSYGAKTSSATFCGTGNNEIGQLATLDNINKSSWTCNGGNTSVGIFEQIGNEISLTLYPNPAVNYIVLAENDLNINNIVILDMSGAVVKTVTNINAAIDISTLPAGIYMMQVDAEEGTIVEQFTKQ